VRNYFHSVTRRKAEVKSAASDDTEPTRTRKAILVERQTPVDDGNIQRSARVSRSVYLQKATNAVKARIKGSIGITRLAFHFIIFENPFLCGTRFHVVTIIIMSDS